MGKKPETDRQRFLVSMCGAVLALSAAVGVVFYQRALAGQTPNTNSQDSRINVRYTDVRKEAGITFLQDSTQTEEKYYLETMGTGLAWLDYNQDGLMDLFFVQSGETDAYKPAHPLRSALYRNNGDGTFTDVTEKAGLGGTGHYGQGVAVGDYDNDGYPDIYVTGYGRAILYHNNGDGTFTDVTAKAGVADEGGWSTSAGWFDYDKTAGSTSLSPITSNGRRRQICGVANAAQAIVRIAIRTTTRDRKPSSTTTITTAPSPT